MTAPDAAAPAAPRARLRDRLRRTAPILLVFAAATTWSSLRPKLPRDHDVAIRLGDAAPSVERLELTWSAAGHEGDEPALSTRLAFAPGRAPRSISVTPRLPDGVFTLGIAVDRVAPFPPLRAERRVELGGAATVVPLEAALDDRGVPAR